MMCALRKRERHGGSDDGSTRPRSSTPRAELADDVEVGAYCVSAPRCGSAPARARSHVVDRRTNDHRRGNRFFPFCSIGGAPQDKKYGGEDTELVIGDGNTIRECCTINMGTVQGGGVTRIGSDNWIMAYVHIAHDCLIGDHMILANNAKLAGHVHVGDWAIMGGMSASTSSCTMGAHAMAAGGSIVLRDLPPFVICSGNPAEPHGINTEGLKRRGFSRRNDQRAAARLQDAVQGRPDTVAAGAGAGSTRGRDGRGGQPSLPAAAGFVLGTRSAASSAERADGRVRSHSWPARPPATCWRRRCVAALRAADPALAAPASAATA